MKKIYSLSEGCYSDYGVLYLYERREDAEAEVERLKKSRYPNEGFVEEFELFGPGELARPLAERKEVKANGGES